MRALNVGRNSSDAAPHQSSARQVTTYFKCRDCKHNGGKDRTCIGDECAYALPDDHEPTDMATDKHAQSVR